MQPKSGLTAKLWLCSSVTQSYFVSPAMSELQLVLMQKRPTYPAFQSTTWINQLMECTFNWKFSTFSFPLQDLLNISAWTLINLWYKTHMYCHPILHCCCCILWPDVPQRYMEILLTRFPTTTEEEQLLLPTCLCGLHACGLDLWRVWSVEEDHGGEGALSSALLS